MEKVYASLLQYLKGLTPSQVEKDWEKFKCWNDIGVQAESFVEKAIAYNLQTVDITFEDEDIHCSYNEPESSFLFSMIA